MKQEKDLAIEERLKKMNYPIPVQVWHNLVELGQDKVGIFKVLVDERVKIDDVFNVMFQFFESSLVHNISSIYHFDDNTPIESLMAILEITSMLKLFKVEEDLLQNTLEARISDQNCLYLLDRFYQVLNSYRYEQSSEEWFSMFSKILDYWSFNLKHLIKYCKDILKEINTINHFI